MSVKSFIGLKKKYDGSPKKVRDYFPHFVELSKDFPYDVALSYVFARLELAQNMTLYCGIVKIHRAEATLARNVVDAHHMTREEFREKVKVVYGKAIPASTTAKLDKAEKIRDKVMHGKSCTDADKRNALASVLEYAAEVNAFFKKEAGIEPFGDLRGFKGRAGSLDKNTTRWILRGMGFGA